MNNESLIEFISRFRDATTNRHEKFFLGEIPVEEWSLLFTLTGVDVSTFRRVIDNFGVRHAFKKHGDQSVEVLRGQIAIQTEDFEYINTLTTTAEKVVAELGKKGLFIVRYEKTLEEFIVIYAEELRVRKRELAFQTLYKRKIRKS